MRWKPPASASSNAFRLRFPPPTARKNTSKRRKPSWGTFSRKCDIPLLAEEGAQREPDRAKPQEKLRRAKRGADGVARSASPSRRSLSRRPANVIGRTDHP